MRDCFEERMKLEERVINKIEEKGKKMTGNFMSWSSETEGKGKKTIGDYMN